MVGPLQFFLNVRFTFAYHANSPIAFRNLTSKPLFLCIHWLINKKKVTSNCELHLINVLSKKKILIKNLNVEICTYGWWTIAVKFDGTTKWEKIRYVNRKRGEHLKLFYRWLFSEIKST